MMNVLFDGKIIRFVVKTDRLQKDYNVCYTRNNMAHNADNVFSQLLRFLLCMILLMTSLPFIGLAAIFSLFTDIPHLKIELGADNVVESVHFNLKNTEKKVDEDEDSGYDASEEDNQSETTESDDDENPELYSISKEFADFFFGVKITEMTATYKSIQRRVKHDIERHSGMVGKFLNYDEQLWELLELDENDEEYTLEDIYENLKEKKLIIPIKKINLYETPVCNTPVDCPGAPRRNRGRVGSLGDDDSPLTPKKLDMAQLETLLNDKLTLDTGVLTNITPIPCESFEKEDGAQTPSECPPSS